MALLVQWPQHFIDCLNNTIQTFYKEFKQLLPIRSTAFHKGLCNGSPAVAQRLIKSSNNGSAAVAQAFHKGFKYL